MDYAMASNMQSRALGSSCRIQIYVDTSFCVPSSTSPCCHSRCTQSSKVMIAIPVIIARAVLFVAVKDAARVNDIIETVSRTLYEIASSIPFLAFLFLRHLYPKPLDDLFMESLYYLDTRNPDRPSYSTALKKRVYRLELRPNVVSYVKRTWRKIVLGSGLYLFSLLPKVGRFVFPAAGSITVEKFFVWPNPLRNRCLCNIQVARQYTRYRRWCLLLLSPTMVHDDTYSNIDWNAGTHARTT